MFESIQDFRERATEEDYKTLEEFILQQSNRVAAFPNDNYKFSYSAASKLLRKQGFLGGQKKTPEPEHEEFMIRPGQLERHQAFVDRSFSLPKELLGRLDTLCNDNWQYTKKAIIARLIDEALSKYGY